MYCPFCGVELPDDALYCNHCGRKMPNLNADNQTISDSSPGVEPVSDMGRDTQSACPSSPTSIDNPIITSQSSDPEQKSKSHKTAIIVCIVAAVILFAGIFAIILLINTPATATQENIVGTWMSTTAYYDDTTSQYASIYYTFNSDGSGTETWYDIYGTKYFSRSVTWSGQNKEYMIYQTNTQKKYSFTFTGDDVAKISYGIYFARTTPGAVATPVPTSPMVIVQQGPTKVTSAPTLSPTLSPTSKSTVSATKTPTPAATSASIEYYDREVIWKYRGNSYTTTYSIPEITYNYYHGLDRDRNLAKYATESNNRKVVANIAEGIAKAGDKLGYSNSEKARMVISFVQALPYMTDKESTGYDEYYKYPIETLVDGSGDCEDTSILTAALLREMGIGVVLLNFPGHVAVGVKGDDSINGMYWTYNGDKYFYLETTATGWDIGEIPDEYKNEKAKVIPIN